MQNGRVTPSRILVVRHRQSTYNAERRWTAQADPPLSPGGLRDAAHLAAQLRPLGIGRVVSSDLLRAEQTADVAATAVGAGAVARDPRLREHDIPAWEGLTRDEIEVRFPGMLAAWRERGEVPALPGAEPWPHMERRVLDALAHHAAPGGVTLVVAHAGVLRAVHTALAGEAVKLGRWKGRWVEVAGDRLELGGVERFERPE